MPGTCQQRRGKGGVHVEVGRSQPGQVGSFQPCILKEILHRSSWSLLCPHEVHGDLPPPGFAICISLGLSLLSRALWVLCLLTVTVSQKGIRAGMFSTRDPGLCITDICQGRATRSKTSRAPIRAASPHGGENNLGQGRGCRREGQSLLAFHHGPAMG